MRPFILTLILLFLFFENNSKDSEASETDSSSFDSIRIAYKILKKKDQITFLDGKSVEVKTNIYTDSVIDSILVIKKSFNAEYNHCGKGILNLNLFSELKLKNIAEYNALKMITTAHSITANRQSFYFNGKKSINNIPSKGASVLLNSTIYSLFSSGKNICNILVLDTIHQVGKLQPPPE